MPVEVLCRNPSCDASYGVDRSVVGHNVRCKKCGPKLVAVEEPSAPPTGGKSAVYLAYDDDLDRPVALKFPNTSGMHEAEILERFKREAKAKELSSLVRRDPPMDPREAARLFAKVALAMSDAHDSGWRAATFRRTPS